jgi:hypothetical protein
VLFISPSVILVEMYKGPVLAEPGLVGNFSGDPREESRSR